MIRLKELLQAATVLGLWAAALTSAIGVAQAASLSEIKGNGAMRIGMLVDFPPYGFLNASGQPDGYDYEVAKAFAKTLGVDAEFVQVTGPNRIPFLLSDKVDVVIGSLGITPERTEQVHFSPAYAAMLNVVYGKVDVKVTDGSGLAGHTIAVTRASVQDDALAKVASPEASIQKYDDDATAVQALLSGQSELLGVDTVTIADIEKRMPGAFNIKFELSAQTQGIAVKPGNDELAGAVDSFVQSIIESGELNAIHEKWFQRPLPSAVTGG